MTTSPQETLEQRVQAAIGRALGVRMSDLSTPLGMGLTPGWDSIGHMTVIMELEKAFQTTFPTYRLPELLDVPSIAKTLRDLQSK